MIEIFCRDCENMNSSLWCCMHPTNFRKDALGDKRRVKTFEELNKNHDCKNFRHATEYCWSLKTLYRYYRKKIKRWKIKVDK